MKASAIFALALGFTAIVPARAGLLDPVEFQYLKQEHLGLPPGILNTFYWDYFFDNKPGEKADMLQIIGALPHVAEVYASSPHADTRFVAFALDILISTLDPTVAFPYLDPMKLPTGGGPDPAGIDPAVAALFARAQAADLIAYLVPTTIPGDRRSAIISEVERTAFEAYVYLQTHQKFEHMVVLLAKSVADHLVLPNSAVPEPGSVALMFLGVSGLAILARRRRVSR